jgi:hypothetical protein
MYDKIKRLLKLPYTFEKAEHYKKLFAEYRDRLEFSVVEDLVKENAFDDAVKGSFCQYCVVIHISTPHHGRHFM